jgi:predicted nucleic acid-binding protein
MKFWDSSAILPLCVKESHTDKMLEISKDDPNFAVWWGTSIECCSSLARLRRECLITEAQEDMLRGILEKMQEYWTEIEPTDEVRSHARRLLLRHPLRVADSMQLAAALVWADGNPEQQGFVCLDQRLRDAARSEGFMLIPQMM